MTKILWELSIVCTVFRFWSLVQGMLSSCSVVSLVVLLLFLLQYPQKFVL